MRVRLEKSKRWRSVFEDGDGTGTSPPPPPPPPPPATFSQAQVDDMITKRLRKQKEEQAELLKKIEEFEGAAAMTEEERETFQGQVDNLTASLSTEKEQRTKDQKKAEKDHKKRVDDLELSEKRWKTMYEDSTIERDLTDAAVAADSVKPFQVVRLLRNSTRLVDIMGEDGKPTGVLKSQTKIRGKDEDGNLVDMDLSPEDAIKQMKEQPTEYGNLFKSAKTGGVGEVTESGAGAGEWTPEQLADMSAEQYTKVRKELGLE